MKRLLYHLSCLLLCAMTSLLIACADGEMSTTPTASQTYRVRLLVDMRGYEGNSTRADIGTLEERGTVYVLFHQGNALITGTALYDTSTDLWTVTPSSPLSETDESTCELAFFLAEGNVTKTAVSLTQETRFYTDREAIYQLSEGLLTIQGQLSPAIGRIRFRGTGGQKCTIAGLAFANSFDLNTHKFNLTANKFTATCGDDGHTPYYYAGFADTDKREMTVELTEESGLRRAFGEGVLQAGTSGYVTIPTAGSHNGWALINLNTGGEITFASVTQPSASSIHSTHATLSAQLSSTGGGRVSATGFVIAAHPNPTKTDRCVESGTGSTITVRVKDLTPETTYYARAFAENEAGITYSEEISFKTISKEEDGSDFERDDWDEDENWNEKWDSTIDFDRGSYPEDENWN